MEIKKFDVFRTHEDLFVIISDTLEISTFHDCCGSRAAGEPLDIQNPEEWVEMFEGRIAYSFLQHRHIVVSENHLLETYRISEHNDGYVPFDHGTARLREILGLIAFADKLWGNDRKIECTY